MTITATELKLNLGKYLEIAAHQDIYISRNGKKIARLTNPSVDKIDMLNKLVGILPSDSEDIDALKDERLERQC